MDRRCHLRRALVGPAFCQARHVHSEPVTHAGWGPQTDNPDTFDCSAIVQWAGGAAVQTDAIADVTYERVASQPESANNLKQLGIALHALDAGDCSVDICAQNSPSASPAPDNFALELEG